MTGDVLKLIPPFSNFPKEFSVEVAEKLVSATFEIYQQAMTNLLPTPEKSHYLFNMRDFSRVIYGVMLSRPESTGAPIALKRLWLHEIHRVYYDRLIDDSDRLWFFETARDVLKNNLDVDLNVLCANLAHDGVVSKL